MNKSEFIKSSFFRFARKAVKPYLKPTARVPGPVQLGGVKPRAKGLFGSRYQLTDQGKGLTQGLGIGAAGTAAGGVMGGLSGYDQGNEAGYTAGLDRGLGQGYELAANQVNETPFLRRLMGKYNYDPSQLQPLLSRGLGDGYRDESRHGLIRRALPLF
jgi:hypothetical protein